MDLTDCPVGPGRSSFNGHGMRADVIIPQRNVDRWPSRACYMPLVDKHGTRGAKSRPAPLSPSPLKRPSNTMNESFSFGNYDGVCNVIAMVSCPLLGPDGKGKAPQCYARNIDINNTIIFEPATCLIHMAAIIMTAIMLWHVHSKYTAVGRKEMLVFLYVYGVSEFLVMFLDSAVIPTHIGAYLWFTAIYIGLKTALFWALMLIGFVGFQFAEDGTLVSLLMLCISSIVIWVISFAVSAKTFLGGIKDQGGLWFFEFVFPIIMVLIYVVSQVILVIRTLDELWPINDIALGCLSFVAGLILQYGFNNQICENVKHYIDGTFFGTLCTLFAVMMMYKFWDSITKEDLEFSVGSRHANWDAKDPSLGMDYDSSIQSRTNSRMFDNSRTPSPQDQKEAVQAGFAPGMTRNSSGDSFVISR